MLALKCPGECSRGEGVSCGAWLLFGLDRGKLSWIISTISICFTSEQEIHCLCPPDPKMEHSVKHETGSMLKLYITVLINYLF